MITETEKNKIAIVTGGSRGIGRGIALTLAERGIDIILTYHSNKTEAESAAKAIRELGRKVDIIQLDMGDTSTYGRFLNDVNEILQNNGAEGFDYLVNNAGTGLHASFENISEDDFDTLYRINFKGAYFLTQTLLPLQNNNGSIINISSAMTRLTVDGGSAYAAMKAAVEVFSRYLAKELGPRGITVNAVAPGVIETDFGGGAARDNAAFNEMIAADTALGRVGLPADIGPIVATLAADDGHWVTGQRIEVSGGMSL